MRSFSVVVRYHNLDGEKKEEQFYAYQARIIQHEIDHLNGVLFIDRMDQTELSKYNDRLKRYISHFGDGCSP